MLAYPRSQISLQLGKNGPVGAIYSSSKNGWFNKELFFQQLQHFGGCGTQSNVIYCFLNWTIMHFALNLHLLQR
jgi:hypothetical protein